MSRSMTFTAGPAPDTGASDDFALRALRIVFFTGFALVATVAAFLVLPLAGVALAAWMAWQGLNRRVWSHGDFALRALSIVFFTGFAVVATVLGFVFLPVAGLALAALFVWRGAEALGLPPRAPATTGNVAFDAYRDATLRRLEDERAGFEAFLDRLRASKDKAEFDAFLDARARDARDATGARQD